MVLFDIYICRIQGRNLFNIFCVGCLYVQEVWERKIIFKYREMLKFNHTSICLNAKIWILCTNYRDLPHRFWFSLVFLTLFQQNTFFRTYFCTSNNQRPEVQSNLWVDERKQLCIIFIRFVLILFKKAEQSSLVTHHLLQSYN